jgi:hypothetical protein
LCFKIAKFGWPKTQELALLACFGVFGIVYYAQLQVAVVYQIESFPAAYDHSGLGGLKNLVMTILVGYGLPACIAVAVIFAALLIQSRASEACRRFLLFCLVVIATFCALAALGKYPATVVRHIVWTAGIAAMAAGLSLSTALQSGPGEASWPKLVPWILGGVVTLAIAGNVQRLLPRDRSVISNNELIAWLEAAPPSDIVLYYGARRLVAWQQQRGDAISQHRYFAETDLSSGEIDPTYFSDAYLSQSYETVSKDIISKINDPVGWARMAVIFAMLDNFQGYADFVMDSAPASGSFHIIATHVSTNEGAARSDARYDALLEALSQRGCAHEMELPGRHVFAMKVICP